MISMLDVQCPHCGVKGKIVVPSQGAILIGPCPHCDEMVAVFCGAVLPLDKEVMLNGNGRERRDHLLDVLTTFLEQSIGETLEQRPPEASDEDELATEIQHDGPDWEADAPSPISDDEYQKFLEVGLPSIDNKDYFDAIFNDK